MNRSVVAFLAALCVLFVTQGRAAETASALATVTAGSVTGITVLSGGSGYTRAPGIVVLGGGGSGATATAVLSGDQVSRVVVVTAGSGYSGSPTVTIEPPDMAFGVSVELVPKLTVEGPAGRVAAVEWALELDGPWTRWTNVIVEAPGTWVVDLMPGSTRRFYRVSAPARPLGPEGFVWIAPGIFAMGSPESEAGRYANETEHAVTLTEGFWMSDHEVTQAEYESLIGANPSGFKGEPNRPVEQVTWGEAVQYCQALTIRERLAGRIGSQDVYRLPSEAEWEYAARAGSTGALPGELDQMAWWGGISSEQSHPVKGKRPNGWGLYDMAGNVGEWTADWVGDYPAGGVTNPRGPTSGSFRVSRGGSWRSIPGCVRSANRGRDEPNNRASTLGFRLVLSTLR